MATADPTPRPTGQLSITELERQPFFRRTVWKRNLLLLLAVVLDLAVLVFIMALHVTTSATEDSVLFMGYHMHLAFDRTATYGWVFGLVMLQIWLGYRALRHSLDGEGMTQLFPLDASAGRKFGAFTGKQLVGIVHELAEQMHLRRISRVVIHDRPDPNAYTAYIPGHGNIVVLHTNLLEIMPPEGVRTVIAHELGHIRRGDSLMHMLTNLPRSLMVLLGIIVLAKVGFGIFAFDGFWVFVQRVLFIVLAWLLARWVLTGLTRVANYARQQSEHLADAYAAQACGWGPTVNALLLLGERAEVVHAVMKTLRQQPHLKDVSFTAEQLVRILKRLPPRELDDEKARELAPRLYIEERLAELRDTLCVPLSDESIVEMARNADHELKRRRREAEKESPEETAKRNRESILQEAELEKLLIDWRKFDWDRSGHLDPKETAALVAELRANAARMIFRQFLEPGAEWDSHPTMRGRLLFLYDSFEKPPKVG